MTGQEHVQPSSEPDAAVSTGSGADKAGTPPPPPSESAGTGGLGAQSEQQAAGSPPPAEAPYDLAPEQDDAQDTTAQSPSGT